MAKKHRSEREIKERLRHLQNKASHLGLNHPAPRANPEHKEHKPEHPKNRIEQKPKHNPPIKHPEHRHIPPKNPERQVIDSYPLEVDGAKVEVKITKEPVGLKYNLHIADIGLATSALLAEIRNELVSLTTISMKELTDPEAFQSIKERFMTNAINMIREKLPGIEKQTETFLIGKLIQDMLGLGKIEFLINDPNLEEIVIPSSTELIKVYSKKYGWLDTNVKIEKEDDIINYANIIARRVGKQITVLTPLLDAHLITGDRINAVLYPIGTKGTTITIRKFARDPFTIVDLINNNTCDLETAALIWLAVEYEMNILFSGGTGSGKTSFLNACMAFVPPNQRIVSIEDTRELMLPEFLYWTPLVTRTPNSEGKGEVSMLDLLVNSLRMRPDRIILGEMRREAEAHVLFEAMHTGHSVYATVHADTASETISRLVNPPLNVPANLLKSINLNVVMFRDRRKGIRRVLQVAEINMEKDSAKPNILYRWTPESDKIIKHAESTRFFEDISRNTGLHGSELDRDLNEKKSILSWLIKNKIRNIAQVSKVMNLYYKNRAHILEIMRKNDKSQFI
ncbi:MAG: Flp pilus assembly complex ATPase component TadA [archaeon]|jgi:flagellar protein FlaI|nr:Flp pilus assembly complex ATPase component TadA [archaeon]